jgi:hypothetical protein
MKAFNFFLIVYLISNALAIIILISAFKWPRIGRLLLFFLFAWASWANWNMALNNPLDYLSYADLTFLPIYKSFITGWFRDHIQIVVGLIATVQAIIAVAMLSKGLFYTMGVAAAIIFLLAISPLGVGSAFPCTLILAVSLVKLRKQDAWLWQQPGNEPNFGIE